MHTRLHTQKNAPTLFQGRGSRIYDRVARWALRGLYRRIAEDVAALAPHGGAVLDAGTGPGVLLVEIARRRRDLRVTGLDLSADMVAAAERNAADFGDRVAARVGDVTAPPFPDGSFDLVVTSFSSHHWDDPAGAVPGLARVLRPAGRLAVYDFSFAPFDVLADTAREHGLFTGAPPLRTVVGTGVPVLPRCVRQVMTAAS
ncbi:class I SAM-dependent methyltransferase [Thermobifida halotolerans]|uniref:Class I SAM-dependent methyltransferase n=1 Tax=Thermobifida halotolerans TaxID=483545 RepID=A0AA97LYF8_9ACTN|nr:class I SAM-dependent methyltransferase [Thermobifida halotolerans]UOE20390.1 class I SAM-dependent methyltransferase [Thermobifida halotolerans]